MLNNLVGAILGVIVFHAVKYFHPQKSEGDNKES